jgi:hypothetical protein
LAHSSHLWLKVKLQLGIPYTMMVGFERCVLNLEWHSAKIGECPIWNIPLKKKKKKQHVSQNYENFNIGKTHNEKII